jgi:hypothetical protein
MSHGDEPVAYININVCASRENIRYALKRSKPYGSEKWVAKTVAKFDLQNTLRNPGRPKNGT